MGIGTRPRAQTFRAKKAVRPLETSQLFGQGGTPRMEHELCPIQHRENALTDLTVRRIVRKNRFKLLPCRLPIGGKALRNVAGLPPFDNAAEFLFGCNDR